MTSTKNEIQNLAQEIFAEINSDHVGVNELGIRDGLEIIQDFLLHDELGVAIDHLIYVVLEIEYLLDNDQYLVLKRICEECKMKLSI